MKVIASVVLAACASALPAASQAGVIDLEDVAHATQLEPAILSRGYLLTHAGDFAFVLGNAEEGASISGNGTQRLVSFNTSSITLSRPGGGAFDLLRFDGGESWLDTPHIWATQIRVTGQLLAGGSVSQLFTLDLQKDVLQGMQQFVLGAGFRKLLSVQFSGIGGNPEFSLDNLVVAPDAVAVAAPSGLWLAGLGLAALAGARRRRISSAADAR